jgi:hypothetical protein
VRKKVKIPHVIDSTKLAQPRVRMVEKAIEGVTGLREQLEDYLAFDQPARLKAGEARPSPVMTVSERGTLVPTPENARFEAVRLQELVDGLLRRVLDGESPRSVFALDKKKPGLKSDKARQIAAVAEVARLVEEGFDRAEITALVAEFFRMDARTVERWCGEWKDQKVDVARYVKDLKAAGLL